MITTIYTAKAVKIAIHKLRPDVVICIVEKGYGKSKDPAVKMKRQAIEDLKMSFGDVIEIKMLEVESLYDIYKITKGIMKKINELSKDNEIFIHISEGRKPLAFGLSFAAYMKKNDVKGIYYVVAETNKLLKLPLFSFKINKTQKRILEYIEKDIKDKDSLITKLKKSRSVVYQYIKELQEDGYVLSENKHLELTDLGRIMIL